MYDSYSSVSEKFLELRQLVLARKQPRRMLVQANTSIKGRVWKIVLLIKLFA